jgi:hypothetical protein
MPFDESMFAEGQTMNMYWDQELRNRTKASFEPKPVALPPAQPEALNEPVPEKAKEPMPQPIDEELAVDTVIVTESVDDFKQEALLQPKSTATTVTLWVIVGLAAAFLLFVFYMRSMKKLRV